jgi:hypothetical protein
MLKTNAIREQEVRNGGIVNRTDFIYPPAGGKYRAEDYFALSDGESAKSPDL